MRIFLSVLILILSLQSWTKADDIRDFEIEGTSIGDSLINHFKENEVKNGIDPDLLAARVIESLRAKDTYIFTHPSFRDGIRERYAMIDQCFESAANSPLVGDVASSGLIPNLFR